jgi:hypothetical protein
MLSVDHLVKQASLSDGVSFYCVGAACAGLSSRVKRYAQIQCLLTDRTGVASELAHNLRCRRFLPRQRLKGLQIVTAPDAMLDFLLRHISSRTMSTYYITAPPALCRRLFNVAMRKQYFAAGLSQIEAI